MKNIIIACVSILILFAPKTQYTVIKVIGIVKMKKTGNNIKPSTTFNDASELDWSQSSSNAKVFTIEIGKGEVIFSRQPPDEQENKLEEIVTFALHLNANTGSLSGRGEAIERIPEALQTLPASNGKLVIESENKYLFNLKEFAQDNGQTFFVQIDIPGQNPIIRKLATRADTLLMNYSDLATEKTAPDIKYKLCYFNTNAVNKSQLITAFDPYFDTTHETSDMLTAAILACKNKQLVKEAARDSVYSIIYMNEGKPNDISFSKLFEKHWQVQQ